jgi:hypothetical protein
MAGSRIGFHSSLSAYFLINAYMFTLKKVLVRGLTTPAGTHFLETNREGTPPILIRGRNIYNLSFPYGR